MLIYVTSYSQSAEICDYIETFEFNDSIISNFAEPFEKTTLCKANRAMNLMQMFLLTCSTAKAVALAH
jgi:hypothetical protein